MQSIGVDPSIQTIVGIDIGRTGGVSFLNRKGTEWHAAGYPLPFYQDNRDTSVCSSNELLDIFRKNLLVLEMMIVIERTQAMPGQGVSSMFHYGETTGIVRAVCEIIAPSPESIHWVSPRVWKKELGLVGGKEHKGESIELAKKLYPESKNFLTRKKDDGIAEALLIAHYGLITFNK